MKSTRNLLLLLCLSALILGCATHADRMEAVLQAYEAGDYGQTSTLLRKLEQEDAGNSHVYRLDRGIAELALGRPKEALKALRAARDRMDDLTVENYSSWFGAVLTDDTALDYPGEDYEQILVRALLALADLMADKGDADAFALQVLERQQEIMETFEDDQGNHPKQNYKLVGFGSYLRGILNENDPMTVDVAKREFKRLVSLEPEFEFGAADLERVTSGRHSEPGNGVVHVLALVGLGPIKVEVEEMISAQALAIAQAAWNIHRDRIAFPNLQAIKIPALSYHTDNPTGVEVLVDGHPVGSTATVTDVNEIARQQFESMKAWIVARAVLRRVFKITVTEAAKEAARQARGKKKPNPWVNLGIDLVGNIWTGLERADTRCWAMLPASFQALRIEVPEGDHTLTLHAALHGRKVGQAQSVRLRVRNGFNTYVISLVPTLRGGPPPLTSEPEEEKAPEGIEP